MKNGELDYVWLWILCGLPFGLHRMCLWIVPGGSSLGGGIALFALSFIIAGVIGGFVLVWRLIVAVWYVLLLIYCLIIYKKTIMTMLNFQTEFCIRKLRKSRLHHCEE